MDEPENPLERDYCVSVVLPGGLEKNATVHGRKPVMDLLVTLCASYHLNPSDYTIEVLSPNKNNISFKPNSLIGSLEADKIVLKPKLMEEVKMRRPYMPEASVRLLINYNRSHKAVVRVNPRVALETLLPVVCEKCEFEVETTVLLRDAESKEPLDLTQTLNDHGLREVFAKDTANKDTAPEAATDLPKKERKQKDSTGFLSLFRRRNKGNATEGAESTPASPGHSKQLGVRTNALGVPSSSNLPPDGPKKRRAPPPPMNASLSVPNNLSSCHVGGSQRSAESTLKRTKRRAPAPPRTASLSEDRDSLSKEELKENSSSSSSPRQPSSSSSPSLAHRCGASQAYLPSFPGKDFSDARCALAKVLTSSVSGGALLKSLKKSLAPTSRQRSHGGLEPIQASCCPAEQDWEDPVQRTGGTTFTVVPSSKASVPQRDASPEPVAASQSPGPSPHSDLQDRPPSPPPAEVSEKSTIEEERSGGQSPGVFSTDEAEKTQDEDDFPPPPPPTFLNESTEDERRVSSPSFNGPTDEPGADTRRESSSPEAGPDAASARPLARMSVAPSRFAQAVALAVQRSRLQNAGKGLRPPGAASCPPPSQTRACTSGSLAPPEERKWRTACWWMTGGDR